MKEAQKGKYRAGLSTKLNQGALTIGDQSDRPGKGSISQVGESKKYLFKEGGHC